jgi:KDO2-lipid IV(A) lauroyltransferase
MLWGGVAKSTQALGWHRYLAVDAIAAATSLVRPGRVAECAVRHRRADPGLTAHAARARARASYREYFRTCLDLMWADALTMEAVRRDHPMDGWENIARAEEEHGSGIFCLAHFGNWDMAATMALSRGLALTTVMRDFSPRFFNKVIVWARERRGLEVFTPGRAARGLLHALHHGRFLALLADIPEGGPTVEVQFRGGPVLFSTGPAAMALHTGCPLLPAICYRVDRHYRILVDPPVPTGTVAEMTQTLADRLDALMAVAPDQWYPFNPVWTDEG